MKKPSLLLFLILTLSLSAHAGMTPQVDATNWLRRIAMAAHQLNYSGLIVFQEGAHVESSRIYHAVDEYGEHEKLVMLDGTPREIIRNNEQVFCYYPSKHIVTMEKRQSIRPFPALLPHQLSELSENYRVRKGPVERVAGLDSQVIALEPKDAYRYGRVLWADKNSGLLLKAELQNENGKMIERFVFTQINVGGKIDTKIFRPYPGSSEKSNPVIVNAIEPSANDLEWRIDPLPPGFNKIIDTKRQLAGKQHLVLHRVYSDGLVAISVFIEPADNAGRETGLSQQGPLNVYSRFVSGYKVTVIGAVPPITVTRMAEAVSMQAPALK